MIQGVVFDFGNVLCRVDRPACNLALSSHTSLGPAEVDRLIWGGTLETEAETGRIDSMEQFRRIKAVLGGEEDWTYDCFAQEFRLAIQPHPEGEAALLWARDQGLRCFVLSNTSFLHARAIFDNEVLCTVPELHALSFKLGWMKPDPRCWQWLLKRAGLRAEACIYVDDMPAYCATAAGLGFHAIHYRMGENDLLRGIQGVLYSG